MKLLSRSGSSAAYRCRIALNLKGIDAEVENLRDGAFQEEPYLSLHPQGRIPALLTEAGALVQSAAILEYLDPIPAGMTQDVFMAELEAAVETRSDALMREAGFRALEQAEDEA